MILRRWGYRLSTHDLLSGVALSPKTDRIPCISYVPNPLQSSPKTVFQLVIVSVNDCDSHNTHHIFEKFLQPQQDIGSIQCLDSFLPLCNPYIERKNETVDFMERLPKYPMKSWSSRSGEDIEQAQWSVDKVFRTPRYSQLATRLQIGDRGLSEMELRAGNNRSPLKRTPENGPNKPCSRHCVQVSLFALDEGVKNGSLFHLIGYIIHKALQIDLEISFRKFYAC